MSYKTHSSSLITSQKANSDNSNFRNNSHSKIQEMVKKNDSFYYESDPDYRPTFKMRKSNLKQILTYVILRNEQTMSSNFWNSLSTHFLCLAYF